MISPSNTLPRTDARRARAGAMGLPRRAGRLLPDRRAQLRPAARRATTCRARPHAMLAKQLGLRRVYVLDDGSGFWKGLLTDPFRRAAARLGVRIAGSASFERRRRSATTRSRTGRALRRAGRGHRRRPVRGGERLIKALRARLGAPGHDHGADSYFAFGARRPEAVGPRRPAACTSRRHRRRPALAAARGPALRARHRDLRHAGVRRARAGAGHRAASATRSPAPTARGRRCSRSCGEPRSRTASSATSASTATATSRRPGSRSSASPARPPRTPRSSPSYEGAVFDRVIEVPQRLIR